MVTDTRTTIRTDSTSYRTDTSPAAKARADNANQAALWIVLAVVAFAALGYAFYHYSNPATNPAAATATSNQETPVVNENTNANTQTSPNTGNGAVMNNDTSTAPNTGTPASNSDATSQPSTTGTDSNSSSTAQ